MTPQFKEECKNSANCNRLGKVFYDTDKEISYDNTLASLEFVEDCYVNGSVLGTVNTKGLTVNTIGKEDLYNKDIDAKIGVKYGDSSEEYINIGKYTVDKPNDQETANLGQYKAYDYLDKLNEDYACNITDWADITVADIYEDLCEQSGLTPETLEFDNSDIPVTGDIFEEGYKRKDILSDIAELAGSFVDIDKDTNVVKLKRLETNVENTVSGNSDIYIDDALNHSIYDMKIDGNTSQKTTTGKQMLQMCVETRTQNGVTFIKNADGSVTLDGTATAGTFCNLNTSYSNSDDKKYFTLENGKTYTIYCKNISSNMYFVVRSRTQNDYLLDTSDGNELAVKTYNKTTDEECYGYLYVPTGSSFDNYTVYPMIAEGQFSELEWEEYTGGEPSPSPDYKQAIATLNGDIKIVQIGQNAYNIANRKNPDGYPEISVDENDWVTIDNTTPTRHYVNFFTSNLKLKTDTDYAIVLEVKEASGDGKFILMSDDQDRGQFEETIRFEDIGEMGNNSVQVYIKKSKSSFEKSADGLRSFIETSNGQSNFITFRISVVEDTSITPETFVYKSYESNEYTIDLNNNELVKLADDIKDIIEIDKLGNVSLLKNTTKKIFDGTESWHEFDNQYLMNCVRFRLNYDINDINALCDKLQLKSTNEYWLNDIECLGYSATGYYIVGQIKKSRLDENASLQSFKDFLAENNLTVYHKTTELTTINLGQLTNFKTFEGVNHFFIEANIDTDFEITYAQDIHNVSLDPVVKLTKDNYSSLTKNQKYGPINSLVIKESEAEGENVSLQDDNSIAINGETQVNIVDNIFLYTPELRQQVIDKIWDAVSGLTYYDCKIESYTGLPYLNKGDRISIEDDSGNYFDTYVLKHTFTYDGTFKSVIESPALTLQETKIKSPVSLGQMLTQTRINVDKANKNINLLNSQVSDTNSKIAEINIDLSEISQSVVEINNENASIKESLNDYATNDTVTQQINSVEQKITSNNLKIDVIEETLENGVSKVKTETGFTFDNNGLNISSSDSKVNNTLSEIGMEIEDNSTGETLLFAGFDNELQETVVISKNLTVEKYLNIPHARFERYDNPNHGVGTGCFYIE